MPGDMFEPCSVVPRFIHCIYLLHGYLLSNRKPELLKGVYDMGFNAPSKIQETALPTLLADP